MSFIIVRKGSQGGGAPGVRGAQLSGECAATHTYGRNLSVRGDEGMGSS